MKRATAITLGILAIGVGILAWLGYGTIQDLNAQIGDLRSSVATLQGDLRRAETKATEARNRAEAQEDRAEEAEDLARRLATRARQAEERARSARGEAETARERAEEATRAQRQAAERSEAAILEATRAEQQAQESRERLKELREQRQRDLDRLERSLGRIAETRRTALGLVMNLGDAIEFDFDRTSLRPENRELLSRIAGVLLTAEGFGIQVYGHTDDVGTAEYNQELSERRAQAVRNYLVEAGIDEDLISTKGFGKAVPLVEGTDPEARQRNRRVEIAVVETSGSLPAEFVAEELDPEESENSGRENGAR
ncbi:MAG: OmpA family protein [Thermoanaerobaculia bacterium]|nr:OmpA family protein [Thermoanaerobaculia bacterium]